MPTDTAAIAGLVNVIKASVAPLLDGSPLPEEQRAALALAAEKLAIAAREPEENVYYIATQVSFPHPHRQYMQSMRLTTRLADCPKCCHSKRHIHGRTGRATCRRKLSQRTSAGDSSERGGKPTQYASHIHMTTRQPLIRVQSASCEHVPAPTSSAKQALQPTPTAPCLPPTSPKRTVA